jgi:hypothetical protein
MGSVVFIKEQWRGCLSKMMEIDGERVGVF